MDDKKYDTDEEIEHDMEKMLSGADIQKIVGYPIKIVPFHELTPDLNNELGEYGGFVILYEYEKNRGHYCAVLRSTYVDDFGEYRECIEFFDPIGNQPFHQGNRVMHLQNIDDELQFSPYDTQFHISLKKIINQYVSIEGEKLIVNHYPFQKDSPDINTCGRWVGYRIRHNIFPLDEFKKYFSKIKNKDYEITELTNLLL
jgi:hypothetical protein